MLEIGDIVQAKKSVWSVMGLSHIPLPTGPVFWIHPAGINRIMIEGCGWQFRQEDVDLLYVDVDVSEFE